MISFSFREFLNAVGIILLATGAFAGLSVHAVHIGVHPGYHSHVQEITIGILLMITGLGILILNNNAFRWQHSRGIGKRAANRK